MTHILHIDSSTDTAESSHTRRLSAELVEKLTSVHEGATVTRRDVDADRLPHVTGEFRNSWMAKEGEHTPDQLEIRTRSEGLIDELRQADVIVIGAPMYNFTVPSTLKAWIDHVAVAGQTFKYTDQGPVGQLTGKKAWLVLSSGGVYSEGPFASYDHLSTYLRGILGFIGITDVNTVLAEGVAMGPERDEAAMQAASETIDGIGKRTD